MSEEEEEEIILEDEIEVTDLMDELGLNSGDSYLHMEDETVRTVHKNKIFFQNIIQILKNTK